VVGFILIMTHYDTMIDQAITDTVKVSTAVFSTTVALDFVEGWGKVVTWILGTAYITLKVIQLIRGWNDKSKIEA
jgi:uncharacterized membrane protein